MFQLKVFARCINKVDGAFAGIVQLDRLRMLITQNVTSVLTAKFAVVPTEQFLGPVFQLKVFAILICRANGASARCVLMDKSLMRINPAVSSVQTDRFEEMQMAPILDHVCRLP